MPPRTAIPKVTSKREPQIFRRSGHAVLGACEAEFVDLRDPVRDLQHGDAARDYLLIEKVKRRFCHPAGDHWNAVSEADQASISERNA